MIPQDELDEDQDPIEAFRGDREHKSASALNDAEVVLRDLQQYVRDRHGEDAKLKQMTVPVLVDYANHLRQNGFSHYTDGKPLADQSVNTHLSRLKDFFEWGADYGYPNPVPEARNRLDLQKDSPPARVPEIQPIEWATLIRNIEDIKMRCVIMVFLKTGIRIGELCNLDVCDVNLDHEGFKTEYDHIDFYKHSDDNPERWPDTLYIRSDIKEGHTVEGEHRPAGTKRDRGTPFPVDEELRYELLRWLKVRPPTPDEPNNPLFTKLRRPIGGRVTEGSVRNELENVLDRHEFNWKIDPHDFRRYWNTYLKEGVEWGADVSDSTLQYLRGDSVSDDMLETYTQDWARKVDKPYKNNIYRLHR